MVHTSGFEILALNIDTCKYDNTSNKKRDSADGFFNTAVEVTESKDSKIQSKIQKLCQGDVDALSSVRNILIKWSWVVLHFPETKFEMDQTILYGDLIDSWDEKVETYYIAMMAMRIVTDDKGFTTEQKTHKGVNKHAFIRFVAAPSNTLYKVCCKKLGSIHGKWPNLATYVLNQNAIKQT